MKNTLFKTVFMWSLLLLAAQALAQDNIPDTVTDIDGNVYQTVQIGTQIWMAENLRTTHYCDGEIVESFGFNKDQSNAKEFGRLYRWEATMRGSSGSEKEAGNVQGISPEGWHIPSDQEWTELLNFLEGESTAGGKLKEIGLDHWMEPNTGATNETGFNALPAGWFDFMGEFMGLGEKTFIRSSSSPGGRGGYAWELNKENASLVRVFLHPNDAISVRCIKD